MNERVNRCGLCDESIDEDEDIVLVDGELVHRDCAEAGNYEDFIDDGEGYEE